jgi:hypothetical protein
MKIIFLILMVFGSFEAFAEHIFDTHGLKCTGGMFQYGEPPEPETIQTAYLKFTRVNSEVPDPSTPFHLKYYRHPPSSEGLYEWSKDHTIRVGFIDKMEYLIEHINWGMGLSQSFSRLNRETLLLVHSPYPGNWNKEDQCELISNEKMDETIALIAQEQEKEFESRIKI